MGETVGKEKAVKTLHLYGVWSKLKKRSESK
jgi:hypothetical protein